MAELVELVDDSYPSRIQIDTTMLLASVASGHPDTAKKFLARWAGAVLHILKGDPSRGLP